MKIRARAIGERGEVNDRVSACEQADQIRGQDIALHELVSAGLGQVVQRGVSFGGEIVDHHDFGTRPRDGQLANQPRSDMPERAGDHYAHVNASMVRSMPSVRLHEGRQPVAAENRDGSPTKCRCSIGDGGVAGSVVVTATCRPVSRSTRAATSSNASRMLMPRPLADHEVAAIHLFGVHGGHQKRIHDILDEHVVSQVLAGAKDRERPARDGRLDHAIQHVAIPPSAVPSGPVDVGQPQRGAANDALRGRRLQIVFRDQFVPIVDRQSDHRARLHRRAIATACLPA